MNLLAPVQTVLAFPQAIVAPSGAAPPARAASGLLVHNGYGWADPISLRGVVFYRRNQEIVSAVT